MVFNVRFVSIATLLIFLGSFLFALKAEVFVDPPVSIGALEKKTSKLRVQHSKKSLNTKKSVKKVTPKTPQKRAHPGKKKRTFKKKSHRVLRKRKHKNLKKRRRARKPLSPEKRIRLLNQHITRLNQSLNVPAIDGGMRLNVEQQIYQAKGSLRIISRSLRKTKGRRRKILRKKLTHLTRLLGALENRLNTIPRLQESQRQTVLQSQPSKNNATFPLRSVVEDTLQTTPLEIQSNTLLKTRDSDVKAPSVPITPAFDRLPVTPATSQARVDNNLIYFADEDRIGTLIPNDDVLIKDSKSMQLITSKLKEDSHIRAPLTEPSIDSNFAENKKNTLNSSNTSEARSLINNLSSTRDQITSYEVKNSYQSENQSSHVLQGASSLSNPENVSVGEQELPHDISSISYDEENSDSPRYFQVPYEENASIFSEQSDRVDAVNSESSSPNRADTTRTDSFKIEFENRGSDTILLGHNLDAVESLLIEAPENSEPVVEASQDEPAVMNSVESVQSTPLNDGENNREMTSNSSEAAETLVSVTDELPVLLSENSISGPGNFIRSPASDIHVSDEEVYESFKDFMDRVESEKDIKQAVSAIIENVQQKVERSESLAPVQAPAVVADAPARENGSSADVHVSKKPTQSHEKSQKLPTYNMNIAPSGLNPFIKALVKSINQNASNIEPKVQGFFGAPSVSMNVNDFYSRNAIHSVVLQPESSTAVVLYKEEPQTFELLVDSIRKFIGQLELQGKNYVFSFLNSLPVKKFVVQENGEQGYERKLFIDLDSLQQSRARHIGQNSQSNTEEVLHFTGNGLLKALAYEAPIAALTYDRDSTSSTASIKKNQSSSQEAERALEVLVPYFNGQFFDPALSVFLKFYTAGGRPRSFSPLTPIQKNYPIVPYRDLKEEYNVQQKVERSELLSLVQAPVVVADAPARENSFGADVNVSKKPAQSHEKGQRLEIRAKNDWIANAAEDLFSDRKSAGAVAADVKEEKKGVSLNVQEEQKELSSAANPSVPNGKGWGNLASQDHPLNVHSATPQKRSDRKDNVRSSGEVIIKNQGVVPNDSLNKVLHPQKEQKQNDSKPDQQKNLLPKEHFVAWKQGDTIAMLGLNAIKGPVDDVKEEKKGVSLNAHEESEWISVGNNSSKAVLQTPEELVGSPSNETSEEINKEIKNTKKKKKKNRKKKKNSSKAVLQTPEELVGSPSNETSEEINKEIKNTKKKKKKNRKKKKNSSKAVSQNQDVAVTSSENELSSKQESISTSSEQSDRAEVENIVILSKENGSSADVNVNNILSQQDEDAVELSEVSQEGTDKNSIVQEIEEDLASENESRRSIIQGTPNTSVPDRSIQYFSSPKKISNALRRSSLGCPIFIVETTLSSINQWSQKKPNSSLQAENKDDSFDNSFVQTENEGDGADSINLSPIRPIYRGFFQLNDNIIAQRDLFGVGKRSAEGLDNFYISSAADEEHISFQGSQEDDSIVLTLIRLNELFSQFYDSIYEAVEDGEDRQNGSTRSSLLTDEGVTFVEDAKDEQNGDSSSDLLTDEGTTVSEVSGVENDSEPLSEKLSDISETSEILDDLNKRYNLSSPDSEKEDASPASQSQHGERDGASSEHPLNNLEEEKNSSSPSTPMRRRLVNQRTPKNPKVESSAIRYSLHDTNGWRNLSSEDHPISMHSAEFPANDNNAAGEPKTPATNEDWTVVTPKKSSNRNSLNQQSNKASPYRSQKRNEENQKNSPNSQNNKLSSAHSKKENKENQPPKKTGIFDKFFRRK